MATGRRANPSGVARAVRAVQEGPGKHLEELLVAQPQRVLRQRASVQRARDHGQEACHRVSNTRPQAPLSDPTAAARDPQ